MNQASIVPRYSHRGVIISIYRTGGRFSAQFVLNGSDRQRIERANEFQAVEAAKRKIDDSLHADQTESPGPSIEEMLGRWNLTPIQAACLIDATMSKLKPLKSDITGAVQFYIEQHVSENITVRDAVDKLLLSKQRDTGKHNARDLKSRLENGFAKDFGDRFLCDVSRAEIARWIDNRPVSKRTRRNFHTCIVTLFRWAQNQGYLPENQTTVAERVLKPRAEPIKKEILTPDELRGYIRAALDLGGCALVPLVMQAFSGVRSEELCQRDPAKDRMRWADLKTDEEEPEAHVRENVSKTVERFVYLPHTLISWLRLFPPANRQDPLTSTSEIWKIYSPLVKKSGIRWKKNALRKSYNTYHSALSDSLAETALEAGNSEGIIRKNYQKPIARARKTAREWFAIGPWEFEKEVAAFVNRRKLLSQSVGR